MLFWIWGLCVVVALGLYLRQFYTRFSKHGVKNLTPLPIIGNFLGIFLQQEHISENLTRLYFTFPEERFVGRYDLQAPTILLRDRELIKKVTVKDFDHFIDHRSQLNAAADTIFGRVLIILKGDEWKHMRSTLSPAFTSSKMRAMVPFMVEVGDMMIKSLTEKITASNTGYLDVDVKDLTTRYATDVIASCAFGLKVDSHTEPQNEFYLKGKAALSFSLKQFIIFFGYIGMPRLMKFLRLTFIQESTRSFFRKIVLSTIQDRELRHIMRPDMIHLLMEAKKGQLTADKDTTKDANAGFATVEESSIGDQGHSKVLCDDDLVAQAVLFFVAGYETVSTSMSFLLYELAINPDVQDKLVREIKEYDAKNGGKFDFDSVQKMVYLDMVVSESLRKWPPASLMDRLCTKDYNLGKPNNKASKDYIIYKGEGLVIPVRAIHLNPEYYPDPEKFDPERFSEENKHKILPFTFLPFGSGPRNCIGSRFALCEVKVMVYQLLRSMEVSPAPKTPIPARLAPGTFQMRMHGGHWLRFKIRK